MREGSREAKNGGELSFGELELLPNKKIDPDFMSRTKSIQIIKICLTQNNKDIVKLSFYSIIK